jgi:SAM-dependent methyltransferase
VVGLDRSEAVLSAARDAAAAGAVNNIEFLAGDIYSIKVPDGSFDIVHAHQVLQHLSDPVAALREMARVCRPGGTIAVRDADYAGFIWFPLVDGLNDWLDLYQRAARANRGEPDAGRRLLSWARAAGLRDVRASASVWCFAGEEARAWWGGLWADRILDSDLAVQAEREGLATRGELQEMSRAWRTWSAAPPMVGSSRPTARSSPTPRETLRFTIQHVRELARWALGSASALW